MLNCQNWPWHVWHLKKNASLNLKSCSLVAQQNLDRCWDVRRSPTHHQIIIKRLTGVKIPHQHQEEEGPLSRLCHIVGHRWPLLSGEAALDLYSPAEAENVLLLFQKLEMIHRTNKHEAPAAQILTRTDCNTAASATFPWAKGGEEV